MQDRSTCLGTTGVPLTPVSTMKKGLPSTPTTAPMSGRGDTSNEVTKRFCVVLDESSMHKLSDHLIIEDDCSNEEDFGDFCDFVDDDNVTHSSSEDEDDDSTIDGTNWGLTESDDEDDLNSITAEKLGASAARFSVYSSSNDSSQLSFDYDDEDNFSGEYEDIDEDCFQGKRIDPKSRFFAVPAKRMSMGEMETVVDTVFSIVQFTFRKPP